MATQPDSNPIPAGGKVSPSKPMEANLLTTPSPALRLALSQVEVAALLGVNRRTLNNWHRSNFGPQPIREGERPGARLLYDRSDVEAFAAGAAK